MGHITRLGERRGAYTVLVGKSEGEISLGRPRHRQEDNNYIPTSQTAPCVINKNQRRNALFSDKCPTVNI